MNNYKILIMLLCAFWNLSSYGFDIEKDLLLVHYDCKTDVDDLHSIAAFASLIRTEKYKKLKYHAVAGAYGIQDGLYVPPNELFNLSFGTNWSDAHTDLDKAISDVKHICIALLKTGADIWIAEAGQSDFTAALLAEIQASFPKQNIKDRVHVVQHSTWNEESTAPDKLEYVKNTSDYLKIPDGNAINNGTPGFNIATPMDWKRKISGKKIIEIWELAIEMSNKYNGVDGRYLNKIILAGGMDFSDFVEVISILKIDNIRNSYDYFDYLSRAK